MANPEILQNEPSPIEDAEKKLTDFMAGAEIGLSPKLLAYSDELHRRSLWEKVDSFTKSEQQKPDSNLRMTELELALLQLQIRNRYVQIKGYAAASFKVQDLLSKLQNACRVEFLHDNSFSPKEKAQLEKDSYSEIAWGLYNSLTIEKEN